MVMPKVKEPTKINFVSQKDIEDKNRNQREEVLRILDDLKAVREEAAASSEKH
ncbi:MULTISPECIES: hypothetical protein [Paenibacillus]|uniref:hypothetical protein n=1 Tax=Paenibacillus TaxID=44249 RepID=UPI001561D6F6|nr:MULTISPECIES: hypothetical protein [Paenibacillus]MBX4152594.1 hypothetical protein [Paenibacillus lautus]